MAPKDINIKQALLGGNLRKVKNKLPTVHPP
jgi:hypothetical protein